MLTILIVEDKESMAQMLKETLEAEGYATAIASSGTEGIDKIRSQALDMVITDLKLPGEDGIRVLKESIEDNPLRPVIVTTAFGTVDNAVEAMKEGAFDFITKPFNIDHLLVLIRRALENHRLVTENILLKDELSSRFGLPEMVGKSAVMAEVAENVRKVAPARTTILLLGESGTGKELFARAIHHLSGREDMPFVPINCAAIPKELLEAELFGFEKGAFTGAGSRKLGKFELAHRGTIFLDEIGELDVGLQAKLLRIIQEGEVERIGSEQTVNIDVRIVAASNKDLERAIEEGAFREDLYYRLSVFPIRIPPLRERVEDISPLAEFFVRKYSADLKKGQIAISEEALGILQDYAWKGNVRELENTMERAVILCDGRTVLPEHITLHTNRGAFPHSSVPAGGSLDEVARAALKVAETDRIRRALRESGGNKTRAAETLKVSYKTLLTKIKDYGIT
jgi:DNA-binding NtrC family response regulator